MKINSNKIKSLVLLSLVGSASTNEQKPTNQSEITLNSLPEIRANFTERGNETDPTLVFGGYPISINKTGICTAAFFVDVNVTDDCYLAASSNLLTSTTCCKVGACSAIGVYVPKSDVEIGDVDVSTSSYDHNSGPDYLYMIPYVKPVPYVMGDKGDLYPVVGLGSVGQGGEVCAFGSSSGYLCGKLVETGLTISWDSGSFSGVNKVDLGEGHGFDSEQDLGGPVYTVSNIGERTTAQALGYISSIDNSDLNHKIFYYTPLPFIFDYFAKDISLNCEVKLVTYNETNSQQYDNLLAQIEIPTKK